MRLTSSIGYSKYRSKSLRLTLLLKPRFVLLSSKAGTSSSYPMSSPTRSPTPPPPAMASTAASSPEGPSAPGEIGAEDMMTKKSPCGWVPGETRWWYCSLFSQAGRGWEQRVRWFRENKPRAPTPVLGLTSPLCCRGKARRDDFERTETKKRRFGRYWIVPLGANRDLWATRGNHTRRSKIKTKEGFSERGDEK